MKSSKQAVAQAVIRLIGQDAFDGLLDSGRLVITTSAELNPDARARVGRNFMQSVPTDALARVRSKAFELHLARIHQAKQRAIEQIADVGECAIVSNKAGTQWQMILQDASEAGKWRIQTFDDGGFSGHMVFKNKEEAVEHAAVHGYVLRDDGALDRLFNTPKFQRGLFAADLIRQVNMGLLRFEQANAQMADYDRAQQVLSSVAQMGAQAFVADGGRSMFLLADRIKLGDEAAVYLHEITHRWGMSAMQPQVWQRLLSRVHAWRERDLGSAERTIHDQAQARVRAARVSASLRDEEFFAYAVEEAVSMGIEPRALAHAESAQAWLDEVIGALQQTLLSVSTPPGGVSPQAVSDFPKDRQQLVDVAYAMAQLESPSRLALIWDRLQDEQREQLRQVLRQRADHEVTALERRDDPLRGVRKLAALVDIAPARLNPASAQEWLQWIQTNAPHVLGVSDVLALNGLDVLLRNQNERSFGMDEIKAFINAGAANWLEGEQAHEGWVPVSIEADIGVCAAGDAVPHVLASLQTRTRVDANGQRLMQVRHLKGWDAAAYTRQVQERLESFEWQLRNDYSSYLHQASSQGPGDDKAQRRLAARLAAMAPMSEIVGHFGAQQQHEGLQSELRHARQMTAQGAEVWECMAVLPVLQVALRNAQDSVEIDAPSAQVRAYVNRVLGDPSGHFGRTGQLEMTMGLTTRLQFAAQTIQPLGYTVREVLAQVLAFRDMWRQRTDGEEPPHDESARLVERLVGGYAKVQDVDAQFRPWKPYGQVTGVELTDLVAKNPGHGAGGRVMQVLEQASDVLGLTVYLRPAGPRVRDFYARHGFERASHSWHGFMVRYPHQQGQEMQANVRHSFAGVAAHTADRGNLYLARTRIATGEDPQVVRQSTGWFCGVDGKWRFEIGDSEAVLYRLTRQAMQQFRTQGRADVKLHEVLAHDALFAAYPQLAHLDVCLKNGHYGGQFERGQGNLDGASIVLGVDTQARIGLSVLMHEIQHAVQEIEGFASGGSPGDVAWLRPQLRPVLLERTRQIVALMQPPSYELFWGEERSAHGEKAYAQFLKEWHSPQYQRQLSVSCQRAAAAQVYERLAGEVEARDVQQRLQMTADQRSVHPPRVFAQGVDGGQSDLVIVMGGQEMAAMGLANVAPTSLAQVRQICDLLRVDHSIFEREKDIHLSLLVVPKDQRGKGLGTQAMQALLAYADASAKRVTLTPSTDFGASSKARLQRFYRRFGFKANRGRNRDFTIQESMLREPLAQAGKPGWMDLSTPLDGQQLRTYKIANSTLVLSANAFEPGLISLCSLRTPMTKRGHGSARAAMQALLAQADAQGVRVELSASAMDARTHQRRLQQFYESLGFVCTGVRINALGHPQMLREPLRVTEDELPEFVDVDGHTRPTRNSCGIFIHTSPAQVRNFWRWYAKNGQESCLLDENGRPVVLYHGTNQNIEIFEPRRERDPAGQESGVVFATNDPQVASEFALYRSVWDGANVMPIYARVGKALQINGEFKAIRDVESNIEQLCRDACALRRRGQVGLAQRAWSRVQGEYGVDLSGMQADRHESLRDYAKRMEFEALIFRNVRDDVGPNMPRASDVHVLFDGVSVKSATGNFGQYNDGINDIRCSMALEDKTEESEETQVKTSDEDVGVRRWICNEKGVPIRLYHGTSAQFEDFCNNPRGIFFAESEAHARRFCAIRKGPRPRLIEVYAHAQKVWEVIRYGLNVPYSQMVDQSVESLKKQGYDAMHCADEGVWIVFDSSQIQVLSADVDWNRKQEARRIGQLHTQMSAVREHYMDAPELWLKAPNGEPTNLSQRQWLMVRTAAFKAWFGDWQNDVQNASRALDVNGEPKVYYHGSRDAGFTTFDVNGSGRTARTGAFFTDDHRMASGYAGSSDDAPVYLPEQLLRNPSLVDDLEIHEGVLIDASYGIGRQWYSTQAQARQDLQLPASEQLLSQPGYRVSVDDYEVFHGDDEDVLEYLRSYKTKGAGIYDVFLNTRNTLEIDWNGANWDEGPGETVWRITDGECGDVVDFVYSQEDCDKRLAENENYVACCEIERIYESTNDAARRARDMEYDSVLIKNVWDTGRYGNADNGNVIVVFESEMIKMANNVGSFDPGIDDIRFSVPIMRENDRVLEYQFCPESTLVCVP